MININKIRIDLFDSKNTIDTNFTMYDIQYLTNRIAKKFGSDFKKYDALRAMIDY